MGPMLAPWTLLSGILLDKAVGEHDEPYMSYIVQWMSIQIMTALELNVAGMEPDCGIFIFSALETVETKLANTNMDRL